jgi:hypothetical protein
MSLVHLHLISNHVPVVGIFIGFILLLWNQYRKSSELRALCFFYFSILGVVTLVAYFTGEPAEEAVENLSGISKALIEEHEKAAIFGLVYVEALALLSLATLIFKGLNLASRKWFNPLVLFLALFACLTMARIAYLGGQIRHTEISSSLTE